MPKKRKPSQDWTTEEAMRHLFPKEAVKHLEEIAHKGEEPDSLDEPGDSVHKPNLPED